MLKQRVITAVLLLVVLLAALLYPAAWAFPALMTAVVGGATWEWARLSGYGSVAQWAWAVLGAAGCAAAFASGLVARPLAAQRLLELTTLLWLVAAPTLLLAGIPIWRRWPRLLRMGWGLVVLWAAGLAAMVLFADRRYGLAYLLSLLGLVWAADIAAYFAGRAWGRRKLAPTISPGKSWAGAVGGTVAAIGFAALCAYALPIPNLWQHIARNGGAFVLLPVVIVLVALSVAGDLVESLMKRSMGVKDSSQLLPGHGGVLDRVDALLPVLPAAVALLLGLDSFF